MKPAFADTSYYVAILNRRDAWHSHAVQIGDDVLGHLYTTEYVLVETASMLCKGGDRLQYVSLVRELEADSSLVIIPASPSLFKAGLDVFSARPDKEWSLVDCISFVVMKQHRIREALTTDHHFVQAGFRALLREGSPH